MDEREMASREMASRVPQAPETGANQAKLTTGFGFGAGITHISDAPERLVVLSPRLEHLARQIGGCQTEEVLALVRRIMYEVIKQKY